MEVVESLVKSHEDFFAIDSDNKNVINKSHVQKR